MVFKGAIPSFSGYHQHAEPGGAETQFGDNREKDGNRKENGRDDGHYASKDNVRKKNSQYHNRAG